MQPVRCSDSIICMPIHSNESGQKYLAVCTENRVHVDEVTESPKLVE